MTSCLIKDFLDDKTKEELIELLMTFSQNHNFIKDSLKHQASIKLGHTKSIVKETKKELKSIFSKPIWLQGYDKEAESGDFSNVIRTLSSLLTAEHNEAVIEIGEYILKYSSDYFEQCDDEGYTGNDISTCIANVCAAVTAIDWSNERKILWAIKVLSNDEFDLYNDARFILDRINDVSAWSHVADTYLNRLASLSQTSNEPKFNCYTRNKLCDFVIEALKKSKRHLELDKFYLQEAKQNHKWLDYVEYLLKNRSVADALWAAENGIQMVGKTHPRIRNDLRKVMAEVAEKEGRWEPHLVLAKENFILNPSVFCYQKVLSIATQLNNHDEVKTWAITYLEKGVLGDFQFQWKEDYTENKQFPLYIVLLDIALFENNGVQALKLYDTICSKKIYANSKYAECVAKAIEDIEPNRAFILYNEIIQEALKVAKRSHYSTATHFLKAVRNLLHKQKRNSEWQSYFSSIMDANKARRNFISMAKSLI